MKKTIMLAGAAILVLAFVVCFASVSNADDPAGQKLFMEKKCNSCHSIDSLKIEKKMASSKGGDMSNIGATRDAEWVTKWMNKEVDLEGKKHPAAWTGKPEELKTLADWLATLKK